ncbi:MAG: hypothetical protein HWD59_15050 [Coxiellaceae bacterium]|nr:MAG: hypothetical protein HWD59_15050 [Coxiellaceae bacterium]
MKIYPDSQIVDYLQKLIELLKKNNETTWISCLERLLESHRLEPSIESIECIINTIRQGKFFDLLLFKDGIPLFKENYALDKLRNDLYKQCLHIIETTDKKSIN